jgi:hypothetical protein
MQRVFEAESAGSTFTRKFSTIAKREIGRKERPVNANLGTDKLELPSPTWASFYQAIAIGKPLDEFVPGQLVNIDIAADLLPLR